MAENWASYEKLLKLAAGDAIESPPGNPLPYIIGRSRPKSGGGLLARMLGEPAQPAPQQEEGFFYNFNRLPPDPDKQSSREFIKGGQWKFHISVHPDDVKLAWNSMVEYLQQEGVAIAKVASAATAAEHALPTDPDSGKKNPQAGKMIVLYVADEIGGQPAHSAEDWQRIINGVEERLAAAGVRPGAEVITDRAVPGSLYSYYRSDRVTDLMKKAFKQMEDANEEVRGEHFVANARSIMGAKFKEEFDAAYEEAFIEHTVNPPPKTPVTAPPEKLKAIAMQHLDPAQTGFTETDIEAMLPKISAELKETRLSLIELPPEKRYKLPSEEDRFAQLHIDNPHSLRAAQEKGEKARAISQKGG